MVRVTDCLLAWLRVGTGVKHLIVSLRVQKYSNNHRPNQRQSPDKENLANLLTAAVVLSTRNCEGNDHVGNAQRNDKPKTKDDTKVHVRPYLKLSARVRMRPSTRCPNSAEASSGGHVWLGAPARRQLLAALLAHQYQDRGPGMPRDTGPPC
jgi:hypothetical protein